MPAIGKVKAKSCLKPGASLNDASGRLTGARPASTIAAGMPHTAGDDMPAHTIGEHGDEAWGGTGDAGDDVKMKDAKALMQQAAGYRVHFEIRADGLLTSDYFPDRDEPSIAALDDAWKFAAKFAAVNSAVYVNVYVIYDLDWSPVEGYQLRRLNTHPSVKDNTEVVPA